MEPVRDSSPGALLEARGISKYFGAITALHIRARFQQPVQPAAEFAK